VHSYVPNGAGWVLPLVPPPLLFTATLRTTVGQSRDTAGRVLLLAMGLTVATAAAVGLLAGLPWPAAAVLGTIACPCREAMAFASRVIIYSMNDAPSPMSTLKCRITGEMRSGDWLGYSPPAGTAAHRVGYRLQAVVEAEGAEDHS
jgi:hypothetical protein